MVERHMEYTGSDNARRILTRWKQMVPKFVKVMPKDFKRVLQAMKRLEKSGLTGDQAVMASFEESMREAAMRR